jgi:hypothetical protein
MTKEEAEHCLTALCSHLAFLEEVHRRIDAVDPC